jgi:phenylalanyl-tRNA synthetase alpha chain
MVDPTQLTGKQRQFVQRLQAVQRIDSLRHFCDREGVDFNFIKGVLLSGALDNYLTWHRQTPAPEPTLWRLTAKGLDLVGGIPGAALAARLLRGEMAIAPLQTALGDRFSHELAALRKVQAVKVQGKAPNKTLVVQKPELLAQYPHHQAVWAALKDGEELSPAAVASLEWLGDEGYALPQASEDYRVQALDTLNALDLQPVVTTLTSDLLLSDQWQRVDFKPYDIHAPVPDVAYGRPTILTQCIQRIRDIFLNMGFDEMAGCMVESAFWNFDALFTPQDHPAREVQDTFYLANPQTLPLPEDADLVQRVKAVHEANYGGQWTEAEASRAILRAHTTTSTARRLYRLRDQLQGRSGGKYFSIDKVFRNETVDRTHLAEFHQIEGVVVGELLSVRTLMGYLIYFYERLGFKDLKFKPTYNPYTEPSLEVFAYHPPSDQYLEVGNSGLFRQEMLEPLGCGDKSTVAWGLGLERIAMLLYGVDKLSDLIGPDIRLQSV